MTPELMFNLSNGLALLGWLVLAFLPRRWGAFPIPTRFVIPAVLGVAYSVAIVPGLLAASGDFTSLEGLKRLYEGAPDALIVAGWQHYLAFDLFVGTWIAERLDSLRVNRVVQLPVLAATFLAGPAGLVLAFIIEVAVRAMRAQKARAAA